MSHHPANDELSAFLDGELTEAEAAALEAALESDAELRAELDRIKGVQRLLRAHGPSRAPDGFAQRVLQAAAEEEKVVAFPWWRRPFGVPVEGVLIAAAAALVLIVALPRSSAPPVPDAAPAAAVEQADQGAEDAGEGLADAGDAEEIGQVGLGTSGQGVGGGGASSGYGAGAGGLGSKGASKGAGTVAPAPKSAPEPVDGSAGVGEVDLGATDNAALPEEGKAVTQGADGTADPGDPVLASVGIQAEIYTEDEELLGALQATVARFGGAIRDSAGKPVKTGLLVAPETQLYLDVPADQVTGLTKALRSLGADVATTGSSALTAGASMKMPLRVVLMGSGPSTGKETAPNATKNRVEALEASDIKE